MTREEASKEIAKKIDAAKRLISECEEIADQTGVGFDWDGPGYGMGGYYQPAPITAEDSDWTSSDETGWQASSQSC